MKKFSQFNIEVESNSFTGDKIKIERVLNKQIEVIAYKIEDSKFKEKGNGKCLTLQIKIKEEMHIVFSGSVTLMQQIEKVSKEDFPFESTIIKDNDRYQFT